MIKRIICLLSFAWFINAVSGCAMGSANVSDGRYISPLDNFSLPVPQLAFSTRLSETSDSRTGFVSFHGDMGGLYGIGYMLVQSTDEEMYNDPVFRDRAYSSYLHNFFVQDILKQAPQSEVLHEEFAGEGENRELFAVVNIPGGSHLMDLKSGKRFDSTRALLIFKALRTLYLLQYELSNPVFRDEDFSINETMLERARDSLYDFKESIEFL